ncbi:pilus assembly protein [Cupriavidus sp. 8B]
MNSFRLLKFLALILYCCLGLAPLRGMADDIDIFIGSSGGSASAPKVMIFLDNSVGDLFAAKADAISYVLGTITSTTPIDVGLAMWSPGASPKGAYVRFAPRDMSNATNRTALQNILALIKAKNEYKEGIKNEPEAFYEMYKYYSGLAPYAGGLSSKNPNADASGNSGTYAGATAVGQGLTSGFAFNGDGTYNSTSTNCGRSYIIYIAANNNYQAQDIYGAQKYESLSSGPALPPSSLASFWGDEWTHFLYANPSPQIVTYVLDAASPGNSDPTYTSILQAEAKQGGGTWQYVTSQTQIVNALLKIFAEIQGINSTFASASLPVNTTNRALDKNQVFIPMFRPDPDAKPRWMGNLKQYQLITVGSDTELGDNSSPPQPAVSTQTGFPTDCATSFWTTDSGTYWQNVPETPIPAGKCPNTSYNKYSDAPDGPFVEKGGVAEVIRKGNNTTPAGGVNRTIYTQSGTALTTFNTTSSGLTANLVSFIQGQDVNDENGNTNTTETRPSLHGDSIHSRPLPIDYGGTTGVTTYYGSNDGMLRAINAATGAERWAFVAPEFFSRFQRLMDNSPLVNYPNMPSGITPTPTAKDYYFDGSIGVYQTANNSSVLIYPTMRRGGRMIYALDVTNPASPAFKWKVGCPNLTNDTGCTTGMSGIGQTWSMPKVASSVLGYTGPVLIVGGGYDGCEDANQATPACTSPKGAGVYVLDANTGALIKSFGTTRSVAADVSLVAVATAGVVDHAYAVDTGGNIYRIDFASQVSNWTINRVAYTNGSGRKFLFAPALLPAPGGKIYLAVGSGDREHPLQSQYPYSGVTNRFYVYLDNLAATSANNLDDASIMSDFTAGATCSDAGILPASSRKGWFMNLNQSGVGEQTVTSALIAAGMISFSTNRPIPAVAGSCSTTLGQARGYWVNLFNGSGAIGVTGACGGDRSAIFVGGGLPPSPMIGTVPINGVATTVVIGAAQRSGAASTPISPQKVGPAIIPKRKTIYWKSSGEN